MGLWHLRCCGRLRADTDDPAKIEYAAGVWDYIECLFSGMPAFTGCARAADPRYYHTGGISAGGGPACGPSAADGRGTAEGCHIRKRAAGSSGSSGRYGGRISENLHKCT